jgi:DnaJ-class molecular chaperone
MEKKFAKLNYYEMLDIKPEAASFEIRHAYNNALQMYQHDSLVSYSFFSAEERKEILIMLDKAYLTLINEKERQEYDNELIKLGILTEMAMKNRVKKPVCIFDINREQGKMGATKSANAELRENVINNKRISGILAKKEISGSDLGAIRNELAISMERIAQQTKIRIDYLVSIEKDDLDALPAPVFLKGFIKSYLKNLCIEPVEEISTRYMNNLAQFREKS